MRLHHGLLVAAALASPSFARAQAPAAPAATPPAASVPATTMTTQPYTTAPMMTRRMRGQSVMMGQPLNPTRYTVNQPARMRRGGLLSRLGLRRGMRSMAGR